MRSPDGIILRDDAGKPLIQGNPDRIGIEQYKRQIWERYNCVPEKRVDAPSAIVPVEVLDADLIDREEAALEKVDSLGEFVNLNLEQLRQAVRQAGRSLGQEIAATFLEEVTTGAEESIKSGLNSLGKALSPRRQKS